MKTGFQTLLIAALIFGFISLAFRAQLKDKKQLNKYQDQARNLFPRIINRVINFTNENNFLNIYLLLIVLCWIVFTLAVFLNYYDPIRNYLSQHLIKDDVIVVGSLSYLIALLMSVLWIFVKRNHPILIFLLNVLSISTLYAATGYGILYYLNMTSNEEKAYGSSLILLCYLVGFLMVLITIGIWLALFFIKVSLPTKNKI